MRGEIAELAGELAATALGISGTGTVVAAAEDSGFPSVGCSGSGGVGDFAGASVISVSTGVSIFASASSSSFGASSVACSLSSVPFGLPETSWFVRNASSFVVFELATFVGLGAESGFAGDAWLDAS